MKISIKKIGLPLYFVLSVFIFLMDLITSHNLNVWVIYILLILGVSRNNNKKYILLITILDSIFLIIGLFLFPEELRLLDSIIFGRIIGVITFWVIAYITIRNIEVDRNAQVNEYRFLKTFELAAVGMEHILPNEKWLRFNNKFSEMLGYTREELEKLTYQKVTYPDDLVKERELKQKLLNNEIKDFTIEKRYFKKDGTILWAYLTCSLLYEEYSGLTYIVSVVKDITDHKKAEEQIQYQADLLENVSDAVVSTNEEFLIRSWNKASEKLYGWTSEEAIGKSFSQLVLTEYLNITRDEVLSVFKENGFWAGEVIQYDKAGKPKNIFASITLIKNKNTHSSSIVALNRDVTEQIQATIALRKNEATLRGILDAVQESIWLFDKNGVILLGNETAFKRMGKTSPEIIGKNFKELVPSDITISRQERLNQVFETGKPVQFEDFRNNIYFLHSFFPVFDNKGNVVSIAAFSRDVTEAKKREDILRESEERFRLMFELHKAVMLLIEPETGNIVNANNAAIEFYGYSFDKLTGMSIQEINQLKAEEVANERLKAADSQENYFIFPHQIANGQIRWVEVYSSPVIVNNKTLLFSVIHDVTERKMAEDQIQHQAGLLANVHDAIMATDENLKLTYWNKTAEEILGWKEEEVLGKYSSELLQTIFPNSSRESAMKILNETGFYESELQYRHKNGSYRTVHTRTTLLYSSNGKTRGIVASFRDITERRQLEENLRRRVEEVETLMELTPIAIWVADDPQCNIIRGNRMANQFYEADRNENVSANVSPVRRFFRNGVELKPEELTMQEAVAKNIDIRNSDLDVLLPSGNWLYMLGSASPLRDSSGNVRGCVGAFLDVTERRKIEKEVELSKQWLERIADTTPDIIFILDIIENKNIYSNKSLLELLGYSPDEFKGLENIFESVIFHDDLGRVKDFYSNMLNARPGEIRVISHRSLRKDGSICWLEVRATPFSSDKDGRFKEIIGIAHDITDIKNAQLKLEETLEELKRSNKDLEQFAYIASHDLQEPLRMVKGYTDLLMKRYSQNFNEDQLEYFGFISDGATRMYQLINALLQYSRITSKGKDFEIVDCNDVVQAVLTDLKLMIAEEKAKISVTGLPKVLGDKIMLRQLFQNLIQNAIKFKGNQPPEITIDFEKKAENWLFRVSDNGIGIAPEYHEKIFLIFQRLHSRDKYPGTGIGLAVCKKIVEHHGGQICVDSKQGKGTTFYFTIPV